jgi:hypothetical protein
MTILAATLHTHRHDETNEQKPAVATTNDEQTIEHNPQQRRNSSMLPLHCVGMSGITLCLARFLCRLLLLLLPLRPRSPSSRDFFSCLSRMRMSAAGKFE